MGDPLSAEKERQIRQWIAPIEEDTDEDQPRGTYERTQLLGFLHPLTHACSY